MKPQIRIAPLEWCEDIIAIEQAANALPWNQAALKSCFDAATCDIYLNFGLWNCATERLLAYLIVNQAIDDEWTIMNIVVAPWAQRQGFARQLLMHLCRLANRQQARLLLEVRESNRAARELYSQLKFREIARRKDYYQSTNNERETAIIMQWLPAADYSQ